MRAAPCGGGDTCLNNRLHDDLNRPTPAPLPVLRKAPAADPRCACRLTGRRTPTGDQRGPVDPPLHPTARVARPRVGRPGWPQRAAATACVWYPQLHAAGPRRRSGSRHRPGGQVLAGRLRPGPDRQRRRLCTMYRAWRGQAGAELQHRGRGRRAHLAAHRNPGVLQRPGFFASVLRLTGG